MSNNYDTGVFRSGCLKESMLSIDATSLELELELEHWNSLENRVHKQEQAEQN